MRTNKGFTLIETLTVITIMSIALVIAVPNFNILQANNRVVGSANQIASMLKQGRSEALVQRRNLQFKAINDAASTNVWGSQGWKVINPALDTTLFEQHDVPPTVTISSSPSVKAIVFLAATGMVTKTDATLTDITFTVCDTGSNKEKGADVSMSRFGRIVVIRHANSATCNP